MKRLKYIIQGFYNLLKNKLGLDKNDASLKCVAKERLDICNSCENQSKALGMCKICGCYCRAKVSVIYDLDTDGKSIDGCPIKKW